MKNRIKLMLMILLNMSATTSLFASGSRLLDHEQDNKSYKNNTKTLPSKKSEDMPPKIASGYPKEWDTYEPSQMFGLLNTQNFNTQFLDQWMNAMEACYSYFNADKPYREVNFSRTLYDLAKKTRGQNQHRDLILSTMKRRPEWIEKWYTQTLPILNSFKTQNLSNTIYALGQLGIMPSPVWMNAFFGASKEKLKDFNSQEISNTIYALGQLGITPLSDWRNAFFDASQGQFKEFSPQNLSKEKLQGFNPQEISNTIYALGQLGIMPSPVWRDAF
jgi:hypothetical protein